jgi:hypothetical protein
MGTTGLLVHVMGVNDLALLPLLPPIYRLFFIPALPLEQVLHSELLILVPPHLQRFLTDVYQIVDLLVVYLQKRYVHFIAKSRVRRLSVLDWLVQVYYASRDESLCLVWLTLYRKCLPRSRLSIREYRRVVSLNYSVDQTIHIYRVIELVLGAFITENVVELEHFISLLTQLNTAITSKTT